MLIILLMSWALGENETNRETDTDHLLSRGFQYRIFKHSGETYWGFDRGSMSVILPKLFRHDFFFCSGTNSIWSNQLIKDEELIARAHFYEAESKFYKKENERKSKQLKIWKPLAIVLIAILPVSIYGAVKASK